MTGKELIMYILTNNLEDKEIIIDGVLVGFMNETEAAIKFGVDIPTIRVLVSLGMLKGVTIGDTVYFPKNAVIGPYLG